jgi:hypothetical protein
MRQYAHFFFQVASASDRLTKEIKRQAHWIGHEQNYKSLRK